MKQEWILFALIAMALFSFSNLMLKVAISKVDESYDFRQIIVPLLFALVIILFFFFGPQSLVAEQTKALVIIGLLATVGFVSFMAALQGGKVALVTAIMTLGTPFVALLSFLLLGEKFSIKEIVAIILAVSSVAVLVF